MVLGVWIDRANWNIVGTIHDAKASVVIYNLAKTAKTRKLKIYKYLKNLLTEIQKHVDGTNPEFLEDQLLWSEKLPEECHKKI